MSPHPPATVRLTGPVLLLLLSLLLSACGTDPTSEYSVLSATALQNGKPVTGLSSGGQTRYTVKVPAGSKNLTIKVSGGSGDADLYTLLGAAPERASYDCRPFLVGNDETCAEAAPAAGVYHILLDSYSSFSGVSLVASFEKGRPAPAPEALKRGVRVEGLAGEPGSQTFFTLKIPAGASDLAIFLAGSQDAGDADLYVRRAQRPTSATYDCRPYVIGSSETCNFPAPEAGTYYVMVEGYSRYSGASLLATYKTGGPAPGEGYTISLVYGDSVSDAQKKLFEAAAERWQEVVTGDLPDVQINKEQGACGVGEPAFNGVIDDLVIYADIAPEDGPGGVLASAGPCLISSATGLTSYGVMSFDAADVSGDFSSVILHEMGHVLGIGSLWLNFDLVNFSLVGDGNSVDCVVDAPAVKPRYRGAKALAEWRRLGGEGAIPLEDEGGPGTRCGHWDEGQFNAELMTGYSERGAAEHLSRMTAASLADMGYTVDLGAADPYGLPTCAPECGVGAPGLTPQGLKAPGGERVLRPIGTVGEEGIKKFK